MKESLLRYLERERLAERRASRELRALPVSERVECGEAIAGLQVVSQGGGQVVLRAAEHHAKFREGDILWLSDGEEVESGLAVRLVRYDPARRELTVEGDSREEGSRLRGAGGVAAGNLVLDRRSMDLGDRFASAVEEIFARPGHPILRCLEGEAQSQENEAVLRAALADARARGLDRSQSEAFARALATSTIHLTQGPPGTGKTRLLAEVLDACVARGERVAVVAYTHRAVDQVLTKCGERLGAAKPWKLDSSRAESPELAAAGVRRAPAPDRIPNHGTAGPQSGTAAIVGMTTHAACRAVGKLVFDRVVFDEAGQIPIPHAIAAMRLADRWLFVGDHAQLPPVVAGEHAEEHRVSIFEHLAERYPSTMLETTYRMNAGICAFPSARFYGGRLAPSAAAAERRLASRPGGRFRAALDPASPCVLVEVAHRGATMRSRREAAIAAELLLELMAHHGLEGADLAAVAPFRAQVMAIREELERRAAARAFRPKGGFPLVETVERIQGREREAVVVSLASSDPEWLSSQGEFYFLPNRLNVALTRARTKCVVVASPLAFEARPRSLADVPAYSVFRGLRDAIPHIDGAALEREILPSP